MDCSPWPSRRLSRRLLRHIRVYRVQLTAVLLLNLLAASLSLLQPLPLRVVVDHVVSSAPPLSSLHRWLPDARNRSALMVLALAAGFQVLATLLSRWQGLATNGGF